MGIAFAANKKNVNKNSHLRHRMDAAQKNSSNVLFAVIADGFDRTTLHSLFAERFFLGTFGLFIHV
jgi:hypothetical protein